MDLIIREVLESDLDAVLTLNQSEVPHVGSVNRKKMHWYAENASYFRVATHADELAAFLVGFLPGRAYESPNYRWFCERYDEFAYVDRIAVAEFARRTGIATRFYDDFATAVRDSASTMTCEVNIHPPNKSSMDFHTRLGFRQVGSLDSDSEDKKVALLLKDI